MGCPYYILIDEVHNENIYIRSVEHLYILKLKYLNEMIEINYSKLFLFSEQALNIYFHGNTIIDPIT